VRVAKRGGCGAGACKNEDVGGTFRKEGLDGQCTQVAAGLYTIASPVFTSCEDV
jgi:hypothetical protein